MASPSKVCRNAEPGSAHAKRPIKAAGRCATCHREFRREQTKKSHEKRVGNLYGLLPGEYEILLRSQGGTCAICRVARGVARRLAVDHDHSLEDAGLRESVRGLLCRPCNRLLGYARDDPAFFERCSDYLRNPPARRILGTEPVDDREGRCDGCSDRTEDLECVGGGMLCPYCRE